MGVKEREREVGGVVSGRGRGVRREKGEEDNGVRRENGRGGLGVGGERRGEGKG